MRFNGTPLAKYSSEKRSDRSVRWLAVWQAFDGVTLADSARMLKRSNEAGTAGLQDRCHPHPGCASTLTADETRQRLHTLAHPLSNGGEGTGTKLQDWVAQRFQKCLSLHPIDRFLHEAGFSRQLPRPRHCKRNAEARAVCTTISTRR